MFLGKNIKNLDDEYLYFGAADFCSIQNANGLLSTFSFGVLNVSTILVWQEINIDKSLPAGEYVFQN